MKWEISCWLRTARKRLMKSLSSSTDPDGWQLPKDFMDALEIKGGDKVKVELDENGEKLVLFRSGGT